MDRGLDHGLDYGPNSGALSRLSPCVRRVLYVTINPSKRRLADVNLGAALLYIRRAQLVYVLALSLLCWEPRRQTSSTGDATSYSDEVIV